MSENKVFYSLVAGRELVVEIGQVAKQAFVFFSSRRRHTILQGDWVQTCALPILTDKLDLEIRYERAWPVASRTATAFDVPLLSARGVHRQRGMIALLATNGLTLEPREEGNVTRVGDNLIPATIRDALSATVAHTFRYLDVAPHLSAIGAVRAPEPARFDAQVDTLVSLGDVSTSVITHAEIEIKSGALDVVHL